MGSLTHIHHDEPAFGSSVRGGRGALYAGLVGRAASGGAMGALVNAVHAVALEIEERWGARGLYVDRFI